MPCSSAWSKSTPSSSSFAIRSKWMPSVPRPMIASEAPSENSSSAMVVGSRI